MIVMYTYTQFYQKDFLQENKLWTCRQFLNAIRSIFANPAVYVPGSRGESPNCRPYGKSWSREMQRAGARRLRRLRRRGTRSFILLGATIQGVGEGHMSTLSPSHTDKVSQSKILSSFYWEAIQLSLQLYTRMLVGHTQLTSD